MKQLAAHTELFSIPDIAMMVFNKIRISELN